MGELFEKLSRRRSHIEENSLQFESEPTVSVADEAQPTPRCSEALSAATPRGDDGSKRRSRITSDFRSVIDRQRTLVDELGTSHESEPSNRTADAGQPRLPLLGAPSEGSADTSPTGPKSSRIIDFHLAIDRQRTFVEEGGKTFESKPRSTIADSSHDCATPVSAPSSPQQCSGAPPKVPSLPLSGAADDDRDHDVANGKFDESRELPPEVMDSTEDAVLNARGRVDSASSLGGESAEAGSKARGRVDSASSLGGESAEAGSKGSASRKAERRASKRAAKKAEAPVGSLRVTGNRVAWFCAQDTVDPSGNARSSRESYTSPSFKLGQCEPCVLRFHPRGASGAGAELSLHGPLGEAHLRVAFFVDDQMTSTQDWAHDQTSMFSRQVQHMPIPDAESFWGTFVNDFPYELRRQFDITRKDGSVMLCGLVYTVGGVWEDGGATPRCPKKR